MSKEAPGHFWSNYLQRAIEFKICRRCRKGTEADATEMRLDGRKGLFNGVVVWGIRRQVLDTAACCKACELVNLKPEIQYSGLAE